MHIGVAASMKGRFLSSPAFWLSDPLSSKHLFAFYRSKMFCWLSGPVNQHNDVYASCGNTTSPQFILLRYLKLLAWPIRPVDKAPCAWACSRDCLYGFGPPHLLELPQLVYLTIPLFLVSILLSGVESYRLQFPQLENSQLPAWLDLTVREPPQVVNASPGAGPAATMVSTTYTSVGL